MVGFELGNFRFQSRHTLPLSQIAACNLIKSCFLQRNNPFYLFLSTLWASRCFVLDWPKKCVCLHDNALHDKRRCSKNNLGMRQLSLLGAGCKACLS